MRKKQTRFLLLIASCLLIGGYFWLYPLTGYKTQTVYYRLRENPEITIEFQMQDIGARGYHKRMVKVEPGILWDTVSPVDINTLDKTRWRKVDEYVNELGLKGG